MLTVLLCVPGGAPTSPVIQSTQPAIFPPLSAASALAIPVAAMEDRPTRWRSW